jgi:hypothetical protein
MVSRGSSPTWAARGSYALFKYRSSRNIPAWIAQRDRMIDLLYLSCEPVLVSRDLDVFDQPENMLPDSTHCTSDSVYRNGIFTSESGTASESRASAGEPVHVHGAPGEWAFKCAFWLEHDSGSDYAVHVLQRIAMRRSDRLAIRHKDRIQGSENARKHWTCLCQGCALRIAFQKGLEHNRPRNKLPRALASQTTGNHARLDAVRALGPRVTVLHRT